MLYFKCRTPFGTVIWQEITDNGQSVTRLIDANGNVIPDGGHFSYEIVSVDQSILAAELMPAYALRKCEALRAAYETAMASGFTSSALGTAHFYRTDDGRIPLIAGAAASGRSRNFFCQEVSTGQWSMRLHTSAQMQQVINDGAVVAEGYLSNLLSKIAQVEAATTMDQITAVGWV